MRTNWSRKYHFFLLSVPSTLPRGHRWNVETTKTTRKLDHNNLYHWKHSGEGFAVGADSPH